MSVREKIMSKKIIAICRGIYGEDLMRLAEALFTGGIRLIEVTYDQKDPDHLTKTPAAIELLKQNFSSMEIGAGTVVNLSQLYATAQVGGTFIISPNTDETIIRATKSLGLISMPGAMTPSEVYAAYSYGADFVKLFPCNDLGPSYVKSIRSPLNHIPLIATGGINLSNLETYLSLGMVGAGIGGNLCDKKLIKSGDFSTLEQTAKSYVEIAAHF